MSYSVQGVSYDTRNAALTQLIALWVSSCEDVDDVKSVLNDRDTPAEIIAGWGGSLGGFEAPADESDLADHIKTHKSDIIMSY